MSYQKLLSPEREEFVWKVYNEMHNNELSVFPTNPTDRENRKVYFLQLVNGNKQLSEKEKEYCREKYIYDLELDNALYKWGKPVECEECKSTRYSDRFCENCISIHLQSLFNTWSSGNDIIDNFIQKCQMMSSLPTQIIEWIPYNQFKDVKKLTEGGFSTIYTATWTKGNIIDYNEKKKEFSYLGAQYVVLKCLNNSNDPGKGFFEEVGNF